jgi:hypothetical protein
VSSCPIFPFIPIGLLLVVKLSFQLFLPLRTLSLPHCPLGNSYSRSKSQVSDFPLSGTPSHPPPLPPPPVNSPVTPACLPHYQSAWWLLVTC